MLYCAAFHIIISIKIFIVPAYIILQAQLAGSLGLFGLLRVTKEKLNLGAPMLYLTVGVTSAAGMLALYRFRNS